MIVSCDAFPTIFTERAFKTSVSCDASDNFHRKSFQNDRFVRGFLQISQNKLPKRAFRAMLQTIFIEKASKMIVSCEASFKFHRTMLPKRAFRAMLPTIFTKNARFATVLCDRHTEILREGSSGKIKMCVSLHPKCALTACHPKFQNVRFATAAFPKMYESIDREPTRFAHTKCKVLLYSFGRSTPRF